MTINGTAMWLFALYVAYARERGIDTKLLTGAARWTRTVELSGVSTARVPVRLRSARDGRHWRGAAALLRERFCVAFAATSADRACLFGLRGRRTHRAHSVHHGYTCDLSRSTRDGGGGTSGSRAAHRCGTCLNANASQTSRTRAESRSGSARCAVVRTTAAWRTASLSAGVSRSTSVPRCWPKCRWQRPVRVVCAARAPVALTSAAVCSPKFKSC
jgi:hypothetical protein